MRVIFYRDSSSVIDNPTAPIGQDRDVDPRAVSRHGFVNGVVHDFPHKMV
jgi:hypothetical protein